MSFNVYLWDWNRTNIICKWWKCSYYFKILLPFSKYIWTEVTLPQVNKDTHTLKFATLWWLLNISHYFKDFIYSFLEREEGREKEWERNINMWLSLTYSPLARHVPWLGIKQATLWFAGQRSIRWATTARENSHFITWPFITNAGLPTRAWAHETWNHRTIIFITIIAHSEII